MRRKVMNVKSNKGFTLVELLIAVTVLAVVIVPMAHIFIQAAVKNGKAKKEHNASVVAQNVMEQYKFTSLEKLVVDHNNFDADSIEQIDTDGDFLADKYVFNAYDSNMTKSGGKYYIRGASKEKYFVTVTVDPNTYKSAPGASQTLINSYITPNLSDIYDGNNIVVADEVKRYDDVSTVKLGSSGDRSGITKTTTIEVKTTITPAVPGGAKANYKTSVSILCDYEKAGAVYSTRKFVASKEYTPVSASGNGEIPEIYVMYPLYNEGTASDFSSDVIKVAHKYVLTGTASMSDMTEAAKVYIVEQNRAAGSTKKGIDYNNVYKGTFYTNDPAATPISSSLDLVDIYANFEGIDDLTKGDKSENSLYGITVEVREGSPTGKVVVKLESAKEKDYGTK